MAVFEMGNVTSSGVWPLTTDTVSHGIMGYWDTGTGEERGD